MPANRQSPICSFTLGQLTATIVAVAVIGGLALPAMPRFDPSNYQAEIGPIRQPHTLEKLTPLQRMLVRRGPVIRMPRHPRDAHRPEHGPALGLNDQTGWQSRRPLRQPRSVRP
jgi:hypothetical protein